jgi:hypothetical protein
MQILLIGFGRILQQVEWGVKPNHFGEIKSETGQILLRKMSAAQNRRGGFIGGIIGRIFII